MLTRPKRIVFVGHDASLSGAPILLLQLLLLLRQRPDIAITLVIHRGGPLMDTYKKHFDVILLKPEGYGKGKSPVRRLPEILRNRRQMLSFRRKAVGADLIFSNTIVNGKLMRKIAGAGKPVVTYVHELENVIKDYKRSGDAVYPGLETGVVAYPSQKVKETVLQYYTIPANRLSRLSYYFPFSADAAQKALAARDFRKRFNIPDNAFLVGGMGVACDRKGTDLFIEVCAAVTRVNPGIKFCWTGVFETPETERALRQLVTARQLENRIIFTGPVPHSFYNTAAFDLFFLSSREDPYPLVVLEAAFMEVPAVCFSPSGGIVEFIGEDAGWIVPGFSTEDAAATILRLTENGDAVNAKGKRAGEKSVALHANPALILQQFEDLLALSGLS